MEACMRFINNVFRLEIHKILNTAKFIIGSIKRNEIQEEWGKPKREHGFESHSLRHYTLFDII